MKTIKLKLPQSWNELFNNQLERIALLFHTKQPGVDFLYEKRVEVIKVFDDEMARIKNEYYDIECLGLKLFKDIAIRTTVLYTKKNKRKEDVLIYGILNAISIKEYGSFGFYEFRIIDQINKTHKTLMQMPDAIEKLQKAGKPISLSKILQNKF